MRVAFYAPLKAPTHPVPSGDRRMGRLLIDALARSGHEVELAAIFRSRDGQGDPARQCRIRDVGTRMAARLLRQYHHRAPRDRPQAWLTYHLYHKAPDWLGPTVAQSLGIPYVLVEASFAPKQAGGPWDIGHTAVARAIRSADVLVALNADDTPCVLRILDDPCRLVPVKPFLDTNEFAAAAAARAHRRAELASRLNLDPTKPWLLTVAMMRYGDKLASYELLARALEMLDDEAWQFLVVGDGPARKAVEAAFADSRVDRLRFLGVQSACALTGTYAAADLYIWPAIGEAYGMALLESQAAGVPVVAGANGGVPDVVYDGETGLLAPPGDTKAFAAAVRSLLQEPVQRRSMGAAAMRRMKADHDLSGGGRGLDRALRHAAYHRR